MKTYAIFKGWVQGEIDGIQIDGVNYSATQILDLEKEITTLRSDVTGASSVIEHLKKRSEEVEAHNKKLQETLKQLRADCQEPIDFYNRDGPEFISPAGMHLESSSYVQDKMHELIELIDGAIGEEF